MTPDSRILIDPSHPSSPRPISPRPRRPVAVSTRTIDPFRLLRRHMLLLIGAGFAGVFVGVVVFFLLNIFMPRYSAEMLFEIRAGLNDSREVGSQDITQDDLVLRLASTEAMLLTSREVLTAAAKRPDVQRTLWFSSSFVDEQGVALIDEAVDELEEEVKRKVIPGTNLFGLAFSAFSAPDVPIILNSIGRAYLDERKRLDYKIYDDNIEIFANQLGATTRELNDLGQQIEAFIREKGITTLDDPRSNQLALAMQDVVTRIAEANAGLVMGQSMRTQIAAKLEGTIEPSDEDRRMAQEHPAVRAHEMAAMQAKTMLRELRAKYRSPDTYAIKNAEGRLRALELEYEAKVEEIMIDNLRGGLKAMTDAIERFGSTLEQLEREYEEKGTLLRTLAADMSHYLEMEEQRNHLAESRGLDLELIKEVRLMRLRADASRVAPAQWALTPREKSFPKIEFVVPAVTVLLVGLLTGLLFLREFTDQRVKTASDLLVVPDTRVLGVIPDLQEDPVHAEQAELVVCNCPQSILAESYRQACALLDKLMIRSGHQTLLVVGGLPESGATTVVTNIAAAASAAGRSVIVVDANFRRARLGKAFGLDGGALGLGDLLVKEVTLDQAIQATDHGTQVITAGRPGNRLYERFNNGQFETIMAELRHRFDLVIVDAPPAIVAGDALVLANKVDAAIMVVRAYQEQRGLVARLMNQLIEARCEMLGIMLNRPRGTAGGYFKKNYAVMASYSDRVGEAEA